MESLRYHNTNCYFARSRIDGSLLAIDAGWPSTLYEYKRAMKDVGLSFDRIALAIVTHFHMDHAGLMGEFQAAGIRCLAFENQGGRVVEDMERIIARSSPAYRRIDMTRLEAARTEASRGLLAALGFMGEVLITPGHSPDSVSFLSDEGEAVIGDLPPLGQYMPDDLVTTASYRLLESKGATAFLPAHAPPFTIGAGQGGSAS
jgi:glyoxylase-like metal-dependent hydrolase (beta-lactamase superfamily II)